MSRVVHFEISVEDPQQMGEFYSSVFNWTIVPKSSGSQEYWLIHTGPHTEKGINGGMKRKGTPGHGVVNTVQVDSLKEALTKVTANGGKILGAPITLPGTGFLSYCEDPEGNVFCILENDTEA